MLLTNPGFELSQGFGDRNQVLVFRRDGTKVEQIGRGEDNFPKGWAAWYIWDKSPPPWDPTNKVGHAQPETRDAQQPERVLDGLSGWVMFTFYRIHMGGFYQVVSHLAPGTYRFTVNNHAWSSQKDDPLASVGHSGPYYHRWVGPDGGLASDDPMRQYRARVGLDPNGGRSPFSDDVVWGDWATVYNVYRELPAVEAEVVGGRATVWTQHRFLWPFKHNDAYYDQARFEPAAGVPAQPEPPQFVPPREQYARTYLLYPPTAGEDFVLAGTRATWNAARWTQGGSADDAGMGPQERRVVAVNPDGWEDDLRAFFQDNYAGVKYIPVEAETPGDLERRLVEMVGKDADTPEPSEPEPSEPPANDGEQALGLLIGRHGNGEGDTVELYRRIAEAGLVPPTAKAYGQPDALNWLRRVKEIDPRTVTVGRIGDSFGGVNIAGPGMNDPEASAEEAYRVLEPEWRKRRDYVDYWETVNEQAPSSVGMAKAQARYWLRLMDLAEGDGYHLALFSHSLGTPEPRDWDAVAETDLFRRAYWGGHALSLHEYGLFPHDYPHILGRFQGLYDRHLLPKGWAIPLLITEYNVPEDRAGEGLKAYSLEDWMAQVRQYDALLRRFRYVRGAHLFTVGTVGRAWAAWDPDKIKTPEGRSWSDVLTDWLIEEGLAEPAHPEPTPEPPTPEPAVPWDIDLTESLPRRYDLARWPEGRWPHRQLSEIKEITIHHLASNVQDLHHHASVYLYKDAVGRPAYPYTFVVERDGTIKKCLNLTEANWHDHSPQQRHHLSIGMNGALHTYPPTDAQMAATVRLVKWVLDHPEMNVTLENVRGHRDRTATACPGWSHQSSGMWRDDFYKHLRAVAGDGGGPGGGGTEPPKGPGRGVHGPPVPDAPADIPGWVRRLRDLDIRWYKMLDSGGPRNLELIRALAEAGIEPIVRLWRGHHLPGDVPGVSGPVRALVAAGARFIEPLNEPNLAVEWRDDAKATVAWGDTSVVRRVCDVWMTAARAIVAQGGAAGLPAMAPTDRGGVHHLYSSQMWAYQLLSYLDTVYGKELRGWASGGQLWLAVHAVAMARPLDWTPLRPGGHYDDMCLLGYKRTQQRVHELFGEIPTISTEGGVFSPEHLADLWPDTVRGGAVYAEGTDTLLYTSATWGEQVKKAYNVADIPLCHWHFSDEGVHDHRWLRNGWYTRNGAPRSPVAALRQ